MPTSSIHIVKTISWHPFSTPKADIYPLLPGRTALGIDLRIGRADEIAEGIFWVPVEEQKKKKAK